ncbi:MAG: phosphoribosyl-AMP cyclohydrolase [Proteobacteria bacterium]|nr:phosphoribosyl-AMP cyclohydrolase [Pseudomonadota bacterium]MDA1136359.1 phosphoribosyl-AMP cyclohydrolase [Pseudomonadota bacterium]
MESLNVFSINEVNFNKDGLIPVISQCMNSGKVLMMAWMNKDALEKTIKSKNMFYYSRSRSQLWLKGESSGNFQKLHELRLDCDNDTLLALIEQTGEACHTGAHSCFFKTSYDDPDNE